MTKKLKWHQSARRTDYKVPLNNYTISSPFGQRDGEFHRGLDLAAAQGEPIHSTKEGRVIKAEFHYSWGNYIVIQHVDWTTALYAISNNIPYTLVRQFQKAKRLDM